MFFKTRMSTLSWVCHSYRLLREMLLNAVIHRTVLCKLTVWEILLHFNVFGGCKPSSVLKELKDNLERLVVVSQTLKVVNLL
jgi:hypothetical protein